jgi:hypothetical protein
MFSLESASLHQRRSCRVNHRSQLYEKNLFDPDRSSSRCFWRGWVGGACFEGLALAGAKVAVLRRRLFDEKN